MWLKWKEEGPGELAEVVLVLELLCRKMLER